MTDKISKKRLVYDPETQKNFMVKETRQEIPGNEDITRKVKHHIEDAAKLIPRQLGSKLIGFMCTFVFERSHQDKFDFQSASLVDLDNVNEIAAEMAFKDLRAKSMKVYGRNEEKVRQDTPVSND